MTKNVFLIIALILCLVYVNAQYYATSPQRSYMMQQPYGGYSNYGPRNYYQQQPYQQQYYQQAYRPYYNYPQQQQYSPYYNSPYYNYYNYYNNYYRQQQQYSTYSYPRAAAYSAPTMSIEAGPPNALVSAHLFCMNCGRGRQ
uniref:Uncharacterized protein n=1 Tax=Panagrolaimus davidi TaxID=227884 RepID=A0A914Q6E7_9BILA